MAALEKKRAIPRCLAAKCVSGGVSWRISFGLHDAPAYPALGKIVHESFAEQKPRKLQRAGRQFAAA
jgi:hypothetical protein